MELVGSETIVRKSRLDEIRLTKRNVFFRWMGFAAACLVVTIHLPYGEGSVLEGTLKQGMARGAVPWFFFASGFWLAGRNGSAAGLKAMWLPRVRTLLVPFVVANGLWFVWAWAFNRVGVAYFHATPVFAWTFPCVVKGLGFDLARWPALVPTWYLRTLFLFVPLGWLLVRLLAFGREVGTWGLVTRSVLAAALLGGGWAASDMARGTVRAVLDHTLPAWGLACLGGGLLVRRWCAAEGATVDGRTGWGEVLTRNTFAIYLLHVPIMLTASYVLRPLGMWGWTGTDWGCALLAHVLVGASIAVAEWLRRRCPAFGRVIFGGRGF